MHISIHIGWTLVYFHITYGSCFIERLYFWRIIPKGVGHYLEKHLSMCLKWSSHRIICLFEINETTHTPEVGQVFKCSTGLKPKCSVSFRSTEQTLGEDFGLGQQATSMSWELELFYRTFANTKMNKLMRSQYCHIWCKNQILCHACETIQAYKVLTAKILNFCLTGLYILLEHTSGIDSSSLKKFGILIAYINLTLFFIGVSLIYNIVSLFI